MPFMKFIQQSPLAYRYETGVTKDMYITSCLSNVLTLLLYKQVKFSMSLSHVLRGGGGDSPCCAASCSTANPIFECANSMLLALFALSLSPPRGQLSSLVNFISSLLNLYLISGLPSSRSSGEGGSFLPQKSNSAGSCS